MELAIDPLNREIIRAVGKAAHGGVVPVYPSWVCAWLPVAISDRAVRSRMARLADDGWLIRHGYYGGYSPSELRRYGDSRMARLTAALARAERALKEAQMLAEELAGMDERMCEVA